MFLGAAILVAGAITFCSGAPDEPRCLDSPVAAAPLTQAHRATLTRLAEEAYQSVRYSREGAGADAWRVARSGDCEDGLLWAARELRRTHPELAEAYRFVAVHEGWDRRSAQRVRITHLVLVIEGEGERVVIDTQTRRPRAWRHYADREAFSAPAGMSGRWAPYR